MYAVAAAKIIWEHNEEIFHPFVAIILAVQDTVLLVFHLCKLYLHGLLESPHTPVPTYTTRAQLCADGAQTVLDSKAMERMADIHPRRLKCTIQYILHSVIQNLYCPYHFSVFIADAFCPDWLSC